uniref:hypothetical protein n=1 Tax=Pedobacter schmidteae TaxID=2201271 RepID=UPI0013CF201A|nr:hypothetical protein [Pedobacter schmidteae]
MIAARNREDRLRYTEAYTIYLSGKLFAGVACMTPSDGSLIDALAIRQLIALYHQYKQKGVPGNDYKSEIAAGLEVVSKF